MSDFFTFLSVIVCCGTVLGLAFMIVLSLPQCAMRDICKSVLIAIGCLLYVVSPIDLLPAGLLGPLGAVDDLGALFVGIEQIRKAVHRSNGTVA